MLFSLTPLNLAPLNQHNQSISDAHKDFLRSRILQMAERLLQKAAVDARDAQGNTLLQRVLTMDADYYWNLSFDNQLATHYLTIDLADWLLQKGASATHRNVAGKAPIDEAVQSLEVMFDVDYLHGLGYSLNPADAHQLELILKLMQQGAVLQARHPQMHLLMFSLLAHDTPASLAAFDKLFARVGLPPVPQDDWYLLHAAVALDKQTLVESLLAARADVNYSDAKKDTPLCVAVAFGNLEMVKRLARHGARLEPNCGDMAYTPLEIARSSIQNDKGAMQRLLRSLGARH